MFNIDHLTGQMLGQYELRELLGKGGMGAVYCAYQQGLEREVAIKVLPPMLAADADYVERFTREARTAAALEHPHIVPVYDYGVDREISYIVMRLLAGGTLEQRLPYIRNAEPIPLLDIATLIDQIASGLDYAHSRGIVHRDIKPGNIMFDSHENAYVVDFGIAKLLQTTSQNSLATTGTVIGTPSYMSPEQWTGQKLTPAADQYALACMIYRMLTGTVPFEASMPHALMYQHLNQLPTPAQSLRSGLSLSVAVVIERGLAKSPDDRYPSILAFARAFEEAARGNNTIIADSPTILTTNATTSAVEQIASGTEKRTSISTQPPQLTRRTGGSASTGLIFISLAALVVLIIAAALLIQDSNRRNAPPPTLMELPSLTPIGEATGIEQIALPTEQSPSTTRLPQQPSLTPSGETTESEQIFLATEQPSSTRTRLAPQPSQTPSATYTHTLTATAFPTRPPHGHILRRPFHRQR